MLCKDKKMPQKYWITSHVSQYIFGPRFFHTVSTSLKIKRMASHGSNQQKTWSLKSQFWLWSQWSILKKSNAVPYKFWFCLQCCSLPYLSAFFYWEYLIVLISISVQEKLNAINAYSRLYIAIYNHISADTCLFP